MKRAILLDELAGQITAVDRPHPTRVGIDGVDASGKTTLADELAIEIRRRGRPVIRSSIDLFHRPAAQRYARGPDSAEGYYRDSFDYPALFEALLDPLGPRGSRMFRTAAFDHRSDARLESDAQTAEPDAILLFDGVFLHRPELAQRWDFTVFVEADFDVTLARAEVRDLEQFGSVDAVRHRYQRRYVPGQRLYLADCAPRSLASVIVRNDDPGDPVFAPPAG